MVFGDLGTLNFKCPVSQEKLKSAACNEILLLDQEQEQERSALLFARRMGETKKNICAKWFFW